MKGNNQMSGEGSFYDESSDQSRVKSAIVAKYFDVWARVIVAVQKRSPSTARQIAYIDLFAGPGRYNDGTRSTPLLILEKAIENPDIRDRLVTLFNDKDKANSRSLQDAINALPGIRGLRYKPQVYHHEVGEQIVKMFEQMKLVPTLFFVDPWGYKGLSLRLLNSVVKDWGCDCIFFFNYNRINMGLHNHAVKEHMDALFGPERAADLRKRLEPLSPAEREIEIIEQLCQAIKEMGPKYVLPFRFKDERRVRTKHHLIFVSKHFRAYEIMKDIMARESSRAEQGVPSFEYNPIDIKRTSRQSLLFQLSTPLDELGDMLLTEYVGRTMTVQQIYEQHSVDRPYTKKNYKSVLMQLESTGKIAAKRQSRQRKGAMGDNVSVTFPPEGKGGFHGM